jgi:hypothetical protein
MASVSKWLQIQFGFYAKMEGGCLPHGIQRDTFNCGPVAINTIEHIALGRELWTPTTAVYHHVSWFIQLVKGHDANIKLTQGPQDDRAKIEESQPHIKKSPVESEMENMSRLQENIEDSIDIAIGDHNFPNLAELLASAGSAAETVNTITSTQAASETANPMSLAAILNSTSTTTTVLFGVDSEPAPNPNHPRPSENAENFSIEVDVEMTPVVAASVHALPVKAVVSNDSMDTGKTSKKCQRHNSTDSSQSSDGCATDTQIQKKVRAGEGKSALARASLAK